MACIRALRQPAKVSRDCCESSPGPPRRLAGNALPEHAAGRLCCCPGRKSGIPPSHGDLSCAAFAWACPPACRRRCCRCRLLASALPVGLFTASHPWAAPQPLRHALPCTAAVGLAPPQRTTAEVDAVVREFHEALARSSDMAVSLLFTFVMLYASFACFFAVLMLVIVLYSLSFLPSCCWVLLRSCNAAVLSGRH